jgi:glycosyltransferase involved in cell wall biosynthesis
MNTSVTLCITIFNEEENLKHLFADIKDVISKFPSLPIVFVDNASEDSSKYLLDAFASQHQSSVELVSLDKNVGYGGGLAHAARVSDTDYVCFYSADCQYLVQDLILLLEKFIGLDETRSGHFVLKGNRIKRTDSWQDKVVSRVYTKICLFVLGLDSKDVNGLPKIIPKAYLDYLGVSLSSSFFLDAQILGIAKQLGDEVIEVGVSFRPRERGSSSWSGKRLQTYFRTIYEMLAFRKIIKSTKAGKW